MPVETAAEPERDHLDVLIIGAGLSGVGAACHLTRARPQARFAILEAREAMGGTWDLFRYPGIRSDSDMLTLGYRFRPWTDPASIAPGERIRDYIVATAREHGVDEHVRYQRRVERLAWDSDTARWTATVRRGDTGGTETVTARFVYACAGYYRYDEGYTPDLPGLERFGGQVVHPQHWPEDLDLAGRHVVVIGSGATAVTLVPSLTGEAGHVTMLQRSPSYVTSLPSRDRVMRWLGPLLGARAAYAIARWKSVLLHTAVYQASRRLPGLMRRVFRRRLARRLPADLDIDTHFSPDYDPWDQRLCIVPDGDLFDALSSGRASVVTDTIATVDESGIALGSGGRLDADVLITATGLNLQMLGGIALEVDDAPVDPADTVAYKGMMLSGVPNLAFAVGYTNASWTLKVDLVSEHVCRLLDHMDRRGVEVATPLPPDDDAELRPLIDLSSGYVRRALHLLPRQADRAPWQLHQNYLRDLRLFRRAPLDDGAVRFERAPARAPGALADQRRSGEHRAAERRVA